MVELWQYLVEKIPKQKLELVTITFKNLWLRRNSLVFENNFDSLKKLMQSAYRQYEEFQSITTFEKEDTLQLKVLQSFIPRV